MGAKALRIPDACFAPRSAAKFLPERCSDGCNVRRVRAFGADFRQAKRRRKRDIENAYLAFDPGEEAPINALLGASITYRIATGPREGQKVFTLQTLPASPEGPRWEVAESSGFSLHAGIAAKASQRDKLEHLARYVARPPVATERLSLTEGGQVRCAFRETARWNGRVYRRARYVQPMDAAR
jgi:hypothetical protein